MQLTSIKLESKPFHLTVTDYTATSLADAKPKIEEIARKAGAMVTSYEISPMVLESMPTQSIVTGTFSAPSADAVNAAIALVEQLDSEI